jgi:hypothetical protein
MTVEQIITAAFRKLGLGRTPDDTDIEDFLESLQSMLRYWGSKKILVYASYKETFSTVVGRSANTWGANGNISTSRPTQIVDMFIRDSSGYDYPIGMMYENEYNLISNKSQSGRPDSYFLHPLYPLAYLYLYPTPEIIETVYVSSIKPWTESSSFSSESDTLSFPVEYETAIIYNLAMFTASEYNVVPSETVKKIADATLYTIMARNAATQVIPVSLNL